MSAVIDCHAMVGTGRSWCEPVREVDYQLAELLERGAEAGIDKHCIVAPRQENYAGANRRIAGLARRQPDRLIGFAAHSPQREAGTLDRLLTEEVREMGLRGVKSDGPPTRELMDAARQLKIPVMYLPEMTPWGKGPSRHYHMLPQTYPDVPLILPHIGQYRSITWWAHMEAIDLAKRYSNVYLGLSGIGSFKYMERAAREVPARQLLFGTYAPELDPRVEIYGVRLLKFDGPAEAKVLGGNVAELVAG